MLNYFKEKKVIKEGEEIINDLTQDPHSIPTRWLQMPKVNYSDGGLSFFEKLRSKLEAYAKGNVVITPSFNLTNIPTENKVIGIKINWKF